MVSQIVTRNAKWHKTSSCASIMNGINTMTIERELKWYLWQRIDMERVILWYMTWLIKWLFIIVSLNALTYNLSIYKITNDLLDLFGNEPTWPWEENAELSYIIVSWKIYQQEINSNFTTWTKFYKLHITTLILFIRLTVSSLLKTEHTYNHVWCYDKIRKRGK